VRRLVSLLCLKLAVLSLLAAPAAQAATVFNVGPGLEAVTVPMSRLPSWVQVVNSSAPLYSADTSGGATGSRLARFTFLRVLGGGTSRLRIDVYDDIGNQGLRGWIDPTDVLPSAPGTDWRVSSRPTSLLKTAADGSETIGNLDRFTPLQQLDGPVQNRIQVRVYRPNFTILDQGWVDIADTGPAFAPRARVQSPTPDRVIGLRSRSVTAQQQAFLDATTQAARAVARQTGVPASVTVAQAILESDWGRSQLALSANNYFGIKATSSLGNDGLVWMPTGEFDASGQAYDTISPFRAYKSLMDSMTDHDRLLLTGRYAVAMQVASEPRQFAQQLYVAGYSTDPAYADKLIALMDRYDLYRLDA
jgi:hypothetical protein